MQFIYKGITIERCGPNASGMRYTALTGKGIRLRSDTLSGMYKLIRSYA